jgi:phospholipase/carboxylesterase
LHRQKRIAGVAAFSGALSGAAHLLGEIASKPPVLLVHGEEDNVVPFQSMANAKTALEAAGVKVRAVARPGLGHAIDGAGIALAGDFLREVLASGRAAAGRPA